MDTQAINDAIPFIREHYSNLYRGTNFERTAMGAAEIVAVTIAENAVLVSADDEVCAKVDCDGSNWYQLFPDSQARANQLSDVLQEFGFALEMANRVSRFPARFMAAYPDSGSMLLLESDFPKLWHHWIKAFDVPYNLHEIIRRMLSVWSEGGMYDLYPPIRIKLGKPSARQ